MKLIFIVLVMIFSTACEDSSLAESSDLHSDLLISRDATIEKDLEIDKYIPVWDAEPDAEQDAMVDAAPPIVCRPFGMTDPC